MTFLKKTLSAMLVLLIILSLSSLAYADDVSREELDFTRTGSITAIIRDTATKEPVPGGELILYKVALFQDANSEDALKYSPEFENCGYDLRNLTEAKFANNIANYAINKKLEGKTATVSDDGIAKFENLDLGLYLIRQEKAAENYEPLAPFLLTVPTIGEEGALEYDIAANPKPGTAQPTPTPTPSPTPSPAPTEHPGNSGSTGGNTGGTSGGSSGGSGYSGNGDKAPQTGQLWWPVFVLAAAGAACMITAVFLKDRKCNDNQTEN